MRGATVVTRVVRGGLRATWLAAGFAILAAATLEMLGGAERLLLFTRTDMHRFTSMAMLTGTFRLRSSIALLGFDEQVHDGGVFSNWGFGVPILELPFHAVASKWTRAHFCPDRAIYFVYHLAVTLLVWAGLSSLVLFRNPAAGRYQRDAIAWAATLLVFALALYPLLSCRFTVYEETICYLILAELAALGAYLIGTCSGNAVATVGVAAAAGIGLLVRPTGLIYAVAWTALVFLQPHGRRTKAAFCVVGAAFGMLWMFLNWKRTGSVTDLGFANAVLRDVQQVAMQRFGSRCVETLPQIAGVAAWLFRALFLAVPSNQAAWMKDCHLMVEERPPAAHEPFLGPVVLVGMVWIVLHLLLRGERRLSPYVAVGALVAVFGSYVYAGAGLAWRYAGDFWPLVVLAVAEYVRTLPRRGTHGLWRPAGGVLAVAGFAAYAKSAEPWPSSGYYGDRWETVPAAGVWESFLRSRWEIDKPQPSRRRCGDPRGSLPADGQGWRNGCGVEITTSTYLGVPASTSDRFEVRLETKDLPRRPLALLVNGRTYKPRPTPSGYIAPVEIRRSRLYAPTVLVTVHWSWADPPSGELESIELVPEGSPDEAQAVQ